MEVVTLKKNNKKTRKYLLRNVSKTLSVAQLSSNTQLENLRKFANIGKNKLKNP